MRCVLVLALALLSVKPARATLGGGDALAVSFNAVLESVKAEAAASPTRKQPGPAGEGELLCPLAEGLSFVRLELSVETKEGVSALRFRYDNCRANRTSGGHAVFVRTYRGDKGYDLVIVSEQGALKSQLLLASPSKDGKPLPAVGLGRLANARLAGSAPVDLGPVFLKLPGRSEAVRGRATLIKIREQGSPTDHGCDPRTSTCSDPIRA